MWEPKRTLFCTAEAEMPETVGGKQMKKDVIFGDKTKEALGKEMKFLISWVVRVGDFIFLSGITAVDHRGKSSWGNYWRAV
jgi:hypothetical protein